MIGDLVVTYNKLHLSIALESTTTFCLHGSSVLLTVHNAHVDTLLGATMYYTCDLVLPTPTTFHRNSHSPYRYRTLHILGWSLPITLVGMPHTSLSALHVFNAPHSLSVLLGPTSFTPWNMIHLCLSRWVFDSTFSPRKLSKLCHRERLMCACLLEYPQLNVTVVSQ